jgi:hypothetical protein
VADRIRPTFCATDTPKTDAARRYSDGIGIQRDAASAKPEVFKTGDGWFAYNLITNLAAL